MSDPFADYRLAGEKLLAGGGMFALVDEEVLGQRLSVFAQRSRSIGELLDASAAHGGTEFLVFDGGPRISFAEHRRMVGAAAARLRRDHGIGPGDRVAICAANGPGWVVAAFATMALGGVVVALNSWWSPEELHRAIELTEPSLVFADEKRRAVLGEAGVGGSVRRGGAGRGTGPEPGRSGGPEASGGAWGASSGRAGGNGGPVPSGVAPGAEVAGSGGSAPSGEQLGASSGVAGAGEAASGGRAAPAGCPLLPIEPVVDDLAAGDDEVDWPAVAEDDPAVLLFTSGTSGTPKAVILSHRCLLGFVNLGAFMGARSAMAGELTGSGGPRLAVFPLFHVSGLNPLLTSLTFGGTTVWPVGRFDAGRVIALTQEEGIASWTGSATHIGRLLDHPAIGGLDPEQIRQVGVGGSAALPGLIARVKARFAHLDGSFSSGYGLTESGGLVSYASEAMLAASPDCVGYPLPTVEVKIVDAADAEVPDGELGHVCVRSPLVMRGYWRNPDADAAAFLPDRWLRTEDVGRLEDGLLHIASRRRDLIIRGGENVYPAETEDCLDRHPDVVESAVFGVDDDDLGQAVHAAVVLRPGATVSEEELRRHCAGHLAYFKVPVHITRRSEPLPRNATGKVLKHVLERDPLATGTSDPG